jgi:iron complex transport system substrate-binding protein
MCLGAALLLVFSTISAARSAEFTDGAGRRVLIPDRIGRVLAADPTAEVLVLVLAPDKLAGLGREPRRGDLPPRFAGVPVIEWGPDGNPAHMVEAALRLRPQIIIDASGATPQRVAYADQVQQLTGIPYLLVDDSFARIPQTLRGLGIMLGVGERAADLAFWAEHAIGGVRGRLLIQPADVRPHVYYGRGPDGLDAPLPGSRSGEALDEVGAINVASGLGRGGWVRITPAQLLSWDPPIIIAEERSFYNALQRDRGWRRLSAVRNKRVYLEPSNPYGWIDDPPGVNRLIGLYWLSTLFYPDQTEEDLRTITCDFYDKFYGKKLTTAQIEALVGPAGVKAPEAPQPTAPLLGAPLSSLSPLPPAAAPTAPSTPAPGAPGAPSAPSALAPTAPQPGRPARQPEGVTCTAPTSPGMPLSPLTTNPTSPEVMPPSPQGTAPGVPPPGRRGRPPGSSTPGAPLE